MDTKKTALLSIDNTRTFEDASLNELYVQDGERVAVMTHEIMDVVKKVGGLLYNVLEKHPQGHISFASNYCEYNPFQSIFTTEVDQWEDDKHAIYTPTAWFTLEQLQAHLKENTLQVLRPDHSVDWTPGVELMPPLSPERFDRTIVKGTVARIEEYSGFTNGQLDAQLKADGVETVIITWVATDYCIINTAMDAKKLWYNVIVVMDAIKGVAPRTTRDAIDTMRQAGIQFLTKSELETTLVVNWMDLLLEQKK